MVAIVRTEWSGTSGGPGLTQFAAVGGSAMTAGVAQSLVNAARIFWAAQAAAMPDELRLIVSPVVDVYNESDGELTASYVAAQAPLVVAGTATQGYAGGAGYKVNWNTGVIRNGRRVRGATFIVPAALAIYTNVGEVSGAHQTLVNTAANKLIADFTAAGAPLAVWSRPTDATETKPARLGALTGVVSGSTAQKSAILRGRRD